MEFAKIEQKNLNFYAPRFEVVIDGENIMHSGVQIASVTFTDILRGPDDFSMTINDPDMEWLEAPLLQPGKEVEIRMGYGGKLTPMVVGDITALEPSFSSSGPQSMTIRGFDLLKRLQNGCVFKSWDDTQDSDVASKIADKHKLKTTGIDETQTIHPKIMQNGESDYALLQRRAEENGFEMFVHLRTFYFCKPKQDKTPLTTLTLEKTLTRFTPRLNLANKPSRVSVRGWNPEQRREIVGTADAGQESAVESNRQSASQAIEGRYGTVERCIREPVYTREEASRRAQAALDASSDQFLTGEGECIGIPEIRAGRYIKIEGVGARFSMKYYIERAVHKIDANGYSTTFSVKGNAL